jgi:TrmH family RNA methyltransferase
VIAIVAKPVWGWEMLLSKSPAMIVILDVLQDPGNAASILRTAEAAGAAGVVTTPGTVKLYSPKALRSSAGSTLRLPLIEHVPAEDILQKLGSAGYSFLAADGTAGTLYTGVDWKKPWALILGQEGGGLSSAWKGAALESISIPMKSPVESLNVAAAAAVLLYEARKGQS